METTEHTENSTTLALAVAIGAAILAVFLSLFALGRALSDSGGGGLAVTGGGAASVDVALTEFAIAPDPIEVAEGGSLVVSNDGSAAHNFKVKGTDFGTADLAAGASETLSLDGLASGTYEMFCDIPGHEAAGMKGTIVVGSGEGGGDAGEALTGAAKAEWLRANYEASVAAFPAETEAMGNQWMEPEVLADGTKVFELVLDEVEWEVAPGEFVHAMGYNGQVPGPAIKVDVGDTVTIRIVNELDDQATTLHPHGVFMHPFEVDGVGYVSHDPTMPGTSDEWTFTTKEPSVGMYHGHDNGVHQVINGAFGAFIVGDLVDEWNLDDRIRAISDSTPNIVDEKIMILNDAGEIGLTLNAKSFPATEPYVVRKGEQLLLHYYNEGLTPHPMHLHNNAQLVVAKDGYPLEQPYFADTINVAPGERYTVVIFAEVPGVWVYHCHILTHVEKDDGSVFGMFTALIVEDSGDPELDADTDRQSGNRTQDADEPADAAADDGTAEAEPATSGA